MHHFVGLRLIFHGTMASGGRKICAYHFISQFFVQRIVDMLTNCFNVSAEKDGHL